MRGSAIPCTSTGDRSSYSWCPPVSPEQSFLHVPAVPVPVPCPARGRAAPWGLFLVDGSPAFPFWSLGGLCSSGGKGALRTSSVPFVLLNLLPQLWEGLDGSRLGVGLAGIGSGVWV